MPVDGGGVVVPVGVPRRDYLAHPADLGHPLRQALALEHAQLDLGDVEPAAVLRWSLRSLIPESTEKFPPAPRGVRVGFFLVAFRSVFS